MVQLTNIEEAIIDYIQKMNDSVTYSQIVEYIAIPNGIKLVELNDILENLELNGYLYLSEDQEYQLFSKYNNLAIGEIKCNAKNTTYVVVGKNHITLSPNLLNGALMGDIVVIKRNKFRLEGENFYSVDKILKRNDNGFIFDYIDGEFKPYNWLGRINVHIPSEQLSTLTNGSRVVIKLSLEKCNNYYNGQIVDLVSHVKDSKLDIKTIASINGVQINFSKEAYKQAYQISQAVTEEEIQTRCSNGGLDLRQETIFTIDGEKTKDIDDAVSIKKLDNGNFLLGVHIADVSYYVSEDSILDLEARKRSTSVYPYNLVIPMLPKVLSNGICSLNPHTDRLAFSCIMEISKDGQIIDYKLVDTIINSKMKMTYEKINDIFQNNIIDPEYEPFLTDLSLMLELSEILNKRKFERGYISLGDNDIQFEDNNGIATGISKRKRGKAERMIENFMLAANETVSSFYYYLNMPGIYRNHPEPNIGQLKELVDLLDLNIFIPNNISNPHVIQDIVNRIKALDTENIYNELLIKTMRRAYYSTDNIGHFGLALEYYTHFTSPIRRYPDLATHRVLRQLRDNIINIDTNSQIEKLRAICTNANTKERIADKVERAVTSYKLAEYVEQHITETFTGYIIYISRNGITIKTDEFISGKISMESLKNKGYIYDDVNMMLINQDENTSLHIMDKIELKVKNVDKKTGKIEFDLSPEKKYIKTKK